MRPQWLRPHHPHHRNRNQLLSRLSPSLPRSRLCKLPLLESRVAKPPEGLLSRRKNYWKNCASCKNSKAKNLHAEGVLGIAQIADELSGF